MSFNAKSITMVLKTGRMNLLPNLIAEWAPNHAPNIIKKPIVIPNKKFTCPKATKVMSEIKLDTKFIERAKPQFRSKFIL